MHRDFDSAGAVKRPRRPSGTPAPPPAFSTVVVRFASGRRPKEPAMTSPQDHEAEVTRLRRTFRVAVIAAAVGATIGAGVVVTVVGAVFSVIERPAAEAGKTDTRTEKS